MNNNNGNSNNEEIEYQQVMGYNSESYADLTSEIVIIPQPQEQERQEQEQNGNNQPVTINENPTLPSPQQPPLLSPQPQPPRESNRIRYQRMKFATEQYTKFMKESLEKALQCPISHEPMTDPIIVESGRTFERNDLLNWIRVKEKKTCPETRIPISGDILITNYAIKNLCEEYDQLLKTLNDTDTLMRRQNRNKNRLTIVEYEQEFGQLSIDKKKRRLDHSFRPIEIQKFIRVNWMFIYEMVFYQCGINDDGIEMFLSRGGDIFRNLTELNLEENEITTIREIERLPRLKRLYVGGNKLLTEDCVEYLEHVNERSEVLRKANRRIKVEFKIQPL